MLPKHHLLLLEWSKKTNSLSTFKRILSVEEIDKCSKLSVI